MIILDGVPSSQYASSSSSTQVVHQPAQNTEIPTTLLPPTRYPKHRSSFLWNVRTIALMSTTILSVVPVGLAGRLASPRDFFLSPYRPAVYLTFATGPATFIASLSLYINAYLRNPSRRFAEVVAELCVFAILSMFWYIIGGLFMKRHDEMQGFRDDPDFSCDSTWFDPMSCKLLPSIEGVSFTNATLLLIYSLSLLGFTLYASARGNQFWFCPVYEAEFLAPPKEAAPPVPSKQNTMQLIPILPSKALQDALSPSSSDPVLPPYSV
ncbi:hypothetical protein BDN72DRAFT_833392 [Pluteus cervinus]|uniref:Uncharacterized protein n=1 Tax=Pluteus cervinus TaxID=181527 RepID=A0ACD3B9E9_9AGAR|nr:hypothetical protein BDN72DRAFT_833392 [Pluteus cervinus]